MTILQLAILNTKNFEGIIFKLLMFPHSILEKFAVKLSALEKQSNIQNQKTSPTTNNKGQFLCIEKQRQMISHCLLQDIDESDIKQKGNKSLSRDSPSLRKIQIIEEQSLQEGEIPDPPKQKINALSQQLKYRVRKTWAKPNVQSYQKADKIELETKEEKEKKDTKEPKQKQRINILKSIEDRVRKSWAKPNEQSEEKGEKEKKQIKQTSKQKQKISSHESTIRINSEDNSISTQKPQLIEQDQQLIVKSLKKVCLNENNLPYVYMMDNLVQLYLCNRVPSQLIKIYIKQLSSKYEMPYNKILIFFGIEALIAKFCTTHDINSQFLDNYLCSELEMMLPHIINRVRISNWFVIQRIALGTAKRLGIKKEITDHWILTILNKSKKFLREGKVDVQKIFRVAKSREISSLNLCEEPTQKQLNEVNYFGNNMKLFLSRNQQILQLIQFRDTDEQQLIETSQREGLSNNLTYFKKIEFKAKQNQKQRQKQRQKQKEVKKNKKNKKFEDQNILSNQADKFFSSNYQVQINQQDPQSDFSIISEQSIKKSNQDKSFVQVYDEDKQARRGKKQKKIKQKKMEKEISKQRYNLRGGLREESGLIQKQKTAKQKKQKSKTKEKLMKLQIKQANKKKSKSMKSLQSSNQLKNAISWLEENQREESPLRVDCNLLEKLEKTKKGKKIDKFEIDEEGLVKMDQILFQFFEKKTELTMEMIKQQISRILREEMSIPLKLHRRISDKWLERFRETKIR